MTHTSQKEVKSALISLFHKKPARNLIQKLAEAGVRLYSTGGTLKYIQEMGYDALAVEDITQYPSVFGGRVKTLHPKIFGGILHRRDVPEDLQEMESFRIPSIDMVVVDLYPFEATVSSGASQEEIIEKIDIGGVSLIRAAAKNFKDTWIVPSAQWFDKATQIIEQQGVKTSFQQRKEFAAEAFNISSHYDTAIYSYMAQGEEQACKISIPQANSLRYGENPHQKGIFYGNVQEVFSQLHGKALSYNNLLDIHGAVSLISEFDDCTFAIIKHTNACGVASRSTIQQAYQTALASDPVSAFGGILIANRNIDRDTAYDINKLFFEVILAPGFDKEALQLLQQKEKRIILQLNNLHQPAWQYRSALNGILAQSVDNAQTPADKWTPATLNTPNSKQEQDLLFANKIVKHTKSNAIVLAKEQQLLAAGTGQTSRVDALKQAISKAKEFGHNLEGAVMASDAFFPFPDSVEIAGKEGINSVIQPGGSVRDQQSIDFCNNHNITMVMTGIRHFKH